jgi:hypothetical protein
LNFLEFTKFDGVFVTAGALDHSVKA